VGVIGAVIAVIAAKATPVLQVYAPFSYVIGALAGAIIFILLLWAVLAISRWGLGWPPVPVSKQVRLEKAAPEAQAAASGPDLSAWDKIDPLTLREAACLWAGFDPSGITTKQELGGEPAARRLLILQGVRDGHLLPERGPNISDAVEKDRPAMLRAGTMSVADYEKFYRKNLKTFCEAIGEMPDFLFRAGSATPEKPPSEGATPFYKPPATPPKPAAPPTTPSTRKGVLWVVGCEWRGMVEGGHRVGAYTILTVANQSPMALKDCYANIESIECENNKQAIGIPLILGHTGTNIFGISVNGRHAMNLTCRDLKDVINLPPHLIKLENGGEIPLTDGKLYSVVISLRCLSPILTFARIELVGDGEDIKGKIVDQWSQ
jgi:hypothetical protein